MKKIAVVIAVVLAIAVSTRADLIPIGSVTFTGDFTLNHLYDFNNPGAQPFGSFSNQMVTGSAGIFAPFVHASDILSGQTLWTETNLPLFSLDGFSLFTTFVSISGPDSGRFVLGFPDLTGNGYQPDPDNSISWSFTAPAYDISNFHEDVTGPITLVLSAVHFVPQVPETGSTVVLMGVAAGAVFLLHRRIKTV